MFGLMLLIIRCVSIFMSNLVFAEPIINEAHKSPSNYATRKCTYTKPKTATHTHARSHRKYPPKRISSILRWHFAGQNESMRDRATCTHPTAHSQWHKNSKRTQKQIISPQLSIQRSTFLRYAKCLLSISVRLHVTWSDPMLLLPTWHFSYILIRIAADRNVAFFFLSLAFAIDAMLLPFDKHTMASVIMECARDQAHCSVGW